MVMLKPFITMMFLMIVTVFFANQVAIRFPLPAFRSGLSVVVMAMIVTVVMAVVNVRGAEIGAAAEAQIPRG